MYVDICCQQARALTVLAQDGGALVMLDGGIEDPGRKAKNSLQWILRKVLDARSTRNRICSSLC